MELFAKICGFVFLALILMLTIGTRSKELSLVLGIAVCCMVCMAALEYLRPVIEFLSTLQELGGLNHEVIRILLKVTGIGLICEICALVCSDGGASSLGKAVKLAGTAVILWLSLPLYTMLVDLLVKILGGL